MKFNVDRIKQTFINRNAFIDLLSVLFGVGSWIGVNSVYMQLPLLVDKLPEGWNLPSFLVVIIQIGNIGPFLYTLIQKFSKRKLKDSIMIYCVLVVGTLAAIFVSFFYDRTAYVFGAERSVALFVLVFFLALVGCTSSVLFMPYMGRFREIYLITYLIGEGLSGFLPSTVTLIQGIGGNAQCTDHSNGTITRYVPPPRFDTSDFFIFVFVMLIFSTIAFTLLDRLRMCKKEYVAVSIKQGLDYQYKKEDEISQVDGQRTGGTDEKDQLLSTNDYAYLLFMMAIVCLFGNGIFPSIQSFSCLPYGNMAYHLTVTLSSIANPIACFMAMFLPHKSIRGITILTLIAGVIAAYTLSTALMSPEPPLVGTAGGEAIVVSFFFFSINRVFFLINRVFFSFVF